LGNERRNQLAEYGNKRRRIEHRETLMMLIDTDSENIIKKTIY